MPPFLLLHLVIDRMMMMIMITMMGKNDDDDDDNDKMSASFAFVSLPDALLSPVLSAREYMYPH